MVRWVSKSCRPLPSRHPLSVSTMSQGGLRLAVAIGVVVRRRQASWARGVFLSGRQSWRAAASPKRRALRMKDRAEDRSVVCGSSLLSTLRLVEGGEGPRFAGKGELRAGRCKCAADAADAAESTMALV